MKDAGTLLLQANNISIVFGGLRAVSDFNCELHAGELVGLIGPNGAGKTTVFNMLSGIYTPTEGEINFWDRNGHVHVASKKTPAQLNRIGIARTFQNIRLFNKLTVADNVRIALHSQRKVKPWDVLFRTPRFRRDERQMTEKVEELLQLFKIDNKKDEIAANLPYGEQRKLEIVRALAANPTILLLDEPAAGMNPNETSELMDTIRFVRDNLDMTILLIEHDMKLVSGICEKLTVLNFGEVLAVGDTSDVLNNPEVITAYLGE